MIRCLWRNSCLGYMCIANGTGKLAIATVLVWNQSREETLLLLNCQFWFCSKYSDQDVYKVHDVLTYFCSLPPQLPRDVTWNITAFSASFCMQFHTCKVIHGSPELQLFQNTEHWWEREGGASKEKSRRSTSRKEKHSAPSSGWTLSQGQWNMEVLIQRSMIKIITCLSCTCSSCSETWSWHSGCVDARSKPVLLA